MQPLRPRQPVLVLLSTDKAIFIVVKLISGVVIGLVEHDALELAGTQAQGLLKPGDVAFAQQVEQRLLIRLLALFGHGKPPIRLVELTFQP